MALNDDQEFASLSRVIQALMLLTPDQQRRVLDYAVARFIGPEPAPSDQLRLPGQL